MKILFFFFFLGGCGGGWGGSSVVFLLGKTYQGLYLLFQLLLEFTWYYSGRFILVLYTVLLQLARALESGTCILVYLLFSRMPVNIIQYQGTLGIFNYRIFVKEANFKKLSLNLQ